MPHQGAAKVTRRQGLGGSSGEAATSGEDTAPPARAAAILRTRGLGAQRRQRRTHAWATGSISASRSIPESGALGARLELDPADLLTHGLIVGMTGSGKTGLAIVLVEELLRQGVPVIAIDPKGDLANLLLLFETLDAASFEPWIDAEAARREGKDVKTAAADAAAAWKKGLAEWGLGPADIAALKKAHDAVVFTPGSRAGVPLNVLQSLDAPAVPFDVRRGGPARRDPVDRVRPARPRARRGRPAAVAARRLPRHPDRAELARRARASPSRASSARSPTRPSTRSARCPSRPPSRARSARA